MPVLASSEKHGENNYQTESVKDLAIPLQVAEPPKWVSVELVFKSCMDPMSKTVHHLGQRASKRVRTAHQQHLVSIPDCLSRMVLARVPRLCSVPYMTYSEWTTSFIGLRPVFKVLDNKGGDGNKRRGISPHTWANQGEKEPDEAIPVSKESIRTHPLLKKEL